MTKMKKHEMTTWEFVLGVIEQAGWIVGRLFGALMNGFIRGFETLD